MLHLGDMPAETSFLSLALYMVATSACGKCYVAHVNDYTVCPTARILDLLAMKL
jgi:hypothetical protein